MKALRTPDDRFENLPGYAFEPHYAEIADGDGGKLRVHYVDEGPADGVPVLLMHGEPSWCYLYRKMIPVIAAAGHRVIAPDLVGFGRSDKPTERSDYTYARHVEWMRELLFDVLDLNGVTLFGQDWGGLIGLRLACEHEDRFARIVVGNTGLPTGDVPAGPEFEAWLDFSQNTPDFDAGAMIAAISPSQPGPEIAAAYSAPFPDESYKAGARQFPTLVPIRPDDPAAEANRRAWKVLERWEKPFLTTFSDGDPMTAPMEAVFQGAVPGAASQPHVTIREAGHFLQEDKGEEIAEVVCAFIASTSN